MTKLTRRALRAGVAMGVAAAAAMIGLPPVSAALPATTVVLQPGQAHGKISPMVLGANGRWAYDDFGGWNPATQQAYPAFAQAIQDTGVTSQRYPGGTIANLYHWKQAIGPLAKRVDQVNGSTGEPLDNDFGPDEYGAQLDKLGESGIIVVNFSTGTPQEAAEWVDYMTGKVGEERIGGVDWAKVRAENGHPAPYNIPYWEVGNELGLPNQLYWRGGQSSTDPTTLYAFGGSASFTQQLVGKHSDYRDSAAVSDGSAGQTFVAKYPPVAPGTAHVFVNGQEWTATQDLHTAPASAKVFTLDPTSGQITFGDGTNGAIPPAGSVVTISYTSGPHPGFDAFYAAMKRANPNIQVCAGLSSVAANTEFTKLMGTTHPYDCLQTHTYVSGPSQTNIDPNEYHGELMLEASTQANDILQVQQAIDANAGARAKKIKVDVSEYGQVGNGHPDADPDYHGSLSEGLLMADDLADFIKLGVPVADKMALTDFVNAPQPGGAAAVSAPLNAMIAGPGPTYQLQPTGLVPNLFRPMVSGTAVGTEVLGNPQRTLGDGSELPSLTTVASRAANGSLDVLVINQDPENAVTSTVRTGVTHSATAQVSTLNGPTILSRNLPGDTQVKITDSTAHVGSGAFTYTFPAHSVTLIHLSSARG